MSRVFAGVFDRDAGLSLAVPSPQPADGRTVLLSGPLRNARELGAELGEPAAESERVVALALDRWGPSALSRLRGSFALLAWDGVTRSGLLAVDQLGAGGLFLRESSGGLVFATEIRDLLRVLPQRPAPDRGSVAQWVADGQLIRGATLFEGVRRLCGGCAIHLEGGRRREETYWAPRYAPPVPIGREDAAAELRAALSRSVEASIGHAGSVGVQVSGGLDSSIVAALAREVRGAGVTAYSLVHPSHPELDESDWIDRVTGFLELPVERLEVRGGSALGAALDFQSTWDLPAATAMLAFNEPLLHRAAGAGCSVLVDGEGGDELLGCSEYVVADRVRRLRLLGAFSLARRLPGAGDEPDARFLWALVREFGLRGAAPHWAHTSARRLRPRRHAPQWLRPDAAKTYADLRDDWAWKTLDGPPSWSHLADLLTAGRERMGVYDLLQQRAAHAGVTNVHPLLEDVDLVELVLGLPPELALDPVLTRPLAREAVADLLPDDVRLRADKADFTPLVVGALAGPDRPFVEALLRPPDAEVSAYVRPDAVTTLLDTPQERRSAEWARVVARLATTECWLRSQSDAGFPQRVLEELSADSRGGDRGGSA